MCAVVLLMDVPSLPSCTRNSTAGTGFLVSVSPARPVSQLPGDIHIHLGVSCGAAATGWLWAQGGLASQGLCCKAHSSYPVQCGGEGAGQGQQS